jgi:hypothetical protein
MRLLYASAVLNAAATAFFYWWYAPTLPHLASYTMTNALISSVLHHSHVYPKELLHFVDRVCVPTAVIVELGYSPRYDYTLAAVSIFFLSKAMKNQYLPGRVNLQQALHATAHVIATLGHVLWFKDLSTNK